jgi:cytochrome P450 PksS
MNITSAAFKADPFPFYARLRAEAPVYPTTLPDKQVAWLITRYDDVVAALKDERLVKNRRDAMTPEQLAKTPWVPGVFKPLERNMLDLDAPDHTRLRGLVHKAFTPRLVEQMRARVQSLSDELLDKAQAKGEMDLIHDYALPIPMTIITEILGIPTTYHEKFRRWLNVLLTMTETRNFPRLIWNMMMFSRYLRKLFQERRLHPQDDLISALVQAEEAGDQLSEDELLAMVTILFIAGHETTVNLIGSGMLTLLQHPDQLNKLRNDPTLIKTAVEELVRFTTPVETGTERYAREDVTIAGVTIPRGGLVLAAIASANRDETQFPNPDILDITRDPNRHLGFGQGAHYCLGAPLARLEGQIAINNLLLRMPDLRLKQKPEMLRWRPALVLRGLKALPVTF